MNNELLERCKQVNFKELLESLGYAYFTKGFYNLNIIGVRADKDNRVTNEFDDIIIVEYSTLTGSKQVMFSITTEPGRYYMEHPLNAKGTAILVPGQYRNCWVLGKHNGYTALCQVNPVRVYRDGNKDLIYDLNFSKIDTGLFGINIHRSSEYKTLQTVNMYSAGCQVFQSPKDYSKFINLCKEQMNRWGNKFTYTLLNESDLNFKNVF